LLVPPLNWNRTVVGNVVDPGETSGAITVEFSVFTQESVSAEPPSVIRTSQNWPSPAPAVAIVMAVVADTTTLLTAEVTGTVTAPDVTVGIFTV
jgi:hypothetical protein